MFFMRQWANEGMGSDDSDFVSITFLTFLTRNPGSPSTMPFVHSWQGRVSFWVKAFSEDIVKRLEDFE
ncbi:hypothetical protein Pfo_024632 [Paulownia fortunei]|nr:hypothetical protein Pfo_024632 [Paulownia fortunei]